VPNGYLIQIVNGKAGLLSLEPEIEQLATQSPQLNPFFAPEWLGAWNSQVGMVYNPVLLTVRAQDGELVGFWPFVEMPAILGKGLWPMGYHMADYLDPLYLHDEPALRVCLIEGLDQLLYDHRFIWLPLLRKEFAQDFLRPYFVRKRQPMLFAPGATRHFIELGEQSVEELLQEALGSKSRKTIRYTRKKLEELGQVEFRAMRGEKEVESFLPEFEHIEDASWKSSKGTGLFHHLGMREFYQQLLPMMAGSGRVQLSALLLNQKPIACELAFLIADNYCLHNTSYIPEYAEYSPGRHLLLENLQRAADDGLKYIDFMQGDQMYKQKLGTSSEPIYTVSLFQKSFVGRLNHFIIGGIQKRRAANAMKAKPGKDQD